MGGGQPLVWPNSTCVDHRARARNEPGPGRDRRLQDRVLEPRIEPIVYSKLILHRISHVLLLKMEFMMRLARFLTDFSPQNDFGNVDTLFCKRLGEQRRGG